MIVSFRKAYFSGFIIISLIIVSAFTANAQLSILKKNITITVVNQPLSDVLNRIAKQSSIKFSYNPVELSARRLVTIRANNEPLGKVLTQLLNNPALSFREMGNQVIIFKPANQPVNDQVAEQVTPTLAEKKAEPQPIEPKITVQTPVSDTVRKAIFVRYDTVFVRNTDTLLKVDTIVLRDTIHRFDTVFIEKVTVPSQNNKAITGAKKSRFSVGVDYSQYFGKAVYLDEGNSEAVLIEKIRSAESISYQNFSAGISANCDFKRIGLSSGLYFTRLGEMFTHEYVEQIGGYYRHDTVETYYTITGIDTAWYYITDSTWLNLDYKKYSYANSNAFRYLDIPLTVRLFIVKNDKVTIFIRGGAIAGIHLGSKAMLIDPDNYKANWITSGMINPVVFSWLAGAGATFSISQNIDFTTEVFFRKQITPLLSGYPVDKKYQLPGIKAGLNIKL